MFRDLPASPFQPASRRSPEDNRDRLRRTLADREQRQKALRAGPTASSSRNVDVSRAEFLTREVVGAYGTEAAARLRREFGPEAPRRPESEGQLLEEILRKRGEEFAQRQDRRAAELRKLNEERARLLEERQRVASRRQELSLRPLSPPYSERGLEAVAPSLAQKWSHIRLRPPLGAPPSEPGPQPVRDLVTNTRQQLPQQLERYHELRERFSKERQKLSKPYNDELGLQSYEPFQMPHVALCRGIVEEEVTRFLDSVWPLATENSSQASRASERKRLRHELNALSRQQASQLVAEELLLEITGELAQATAREYHYLDSLAHNMADQLCIMEAGVLATGEPFGRDDDDPFYPRVTEAFYASQRKRNTKRGRLWVHKQHLVTQTDAEAKDQAEEPEDDDLKVIDFEEFHPEHLKNYSPLPADTIPKKVELKAFVDFRREEAVYWNSFNISTMSISLPKAAKGIKSVSVSPNDKFVAIGTARGNVLVYKFHAQQKNTRDELRCVAFSAASSNDPVIHVAWSRDSNQLASVSQLGVVSLWTFNSGSSVSPQEAQQVGVKPDKVTGVYPANLSLIHQQSTEELDFHFLNGPLSKQKNIGDKEWAPTFVLFYPSFTVFGSQYSLVHGMTSNDLVMIDTEPLARNFGKAAQQPTTAENPKKGRSEELVRVIGAWLEGQDDVRLGKEELNTAIFRAHKHPLIHVGFIRHVGDMVSVDQRGYIYVWKLRSEEMTETNWLRPFKKYRLAVKIQNFTPASDPPPLVRFDETSADLKDDDGQKLKKKRKKVEAELSKAGLRHPWIKEQIGGKEILIYRPVEPISESGAMFHEVTRAIASKDLRKYETRVYKPHKLSAEIFLGCAQNTSSTLLVSLLLFPPHERSLPFLEFVIVDLLTMKAKEPRIQVSLTKEQYQTIKKQRIMSFDIGRPLNATGTEYVFLNLLGELRVFSLVSGQSVAKGFDPNKEKRGALASPKEPSQGFRFSQTQFKIRPDTELRLASSHGHFFVLVFKKSESSVRILQVGNSNSEEAGRVVSDCFTALEEKTQYPRELRLGGDNMFFFPEVHPIAGARETVFRAMDAAIQKKAGSFTPEKKKAHDQVDRVHGYALLSDVIANQRKPLPYETTDDKDD